MQAYTNKTAKNKSNAQNEQITMHNHITDMWHIKHL